MGMRRKRPGTLLPPVPRETSEAAVMAKTLELAAERQRLINAARDEHIDADHEALKRVWQLAELWERPDPLGLGYDKTTRAFARALRHAVTGDMDAEPTPRPCVPDLLTLAQSWEDEALAVENASITVSRGAHRRARVLIACAAELRDLIAGRQ